MKKFEILLKASVFFAVIIIAMPFACNNGDDDDDSGDGNPGDATDTVESWTPGLAVSTEVLEPVRGLRTLKGIIHAHSTYSHDGCDNYIDNVGEPDFDCIDDLRTSFCATKLDYAMMTDHAGQMAYYPFDELLLIAEGDEPIERDGGPVANRINCGEGRQLLYLMGSENDIEFSGLEGHLPGTEEERAHIYSGTDTDAVEAWQAGGALAFISHTEGKDLDYIRSLPIDGIENYNLHANMMENLGGVLDAFNVFLNNDTPIPHPDLSFLTLFHLDQGVQDKWDALLSARHTIGFFATDVHRNALNFPMSDGERIDGYRRLTHWFSNFALVDESSGLDEDRMLKEAVGAARLFSVVEVIGFPIGFDYRAESVSEVTEIGGDVSLADSPEMIVTCPTLYGAQDDWEAPEIVVRLYRSTTDGAVEVASSTGEDLTYTPDEPGPYRVVIEMTPNHLRPWLGEEGEFMIGVTPWIVSNAIHVTE